MLLQRLCINRFTKISLFNSPKLKNNIPTLNIHKVQLDDKKVSLYIVSLHYICNVNKSDLTRLNLTNLNTAQCSLKLYI